MKPLRILLGTAAAAAALYGACGSERFDVTIKEPIALREALLSIIDECDLSLSLEGSTTSDRFETAKIGYISLRAVNAGEAVDFLMKRANLHHKLEGDLLTIRDLETRVFKVDYINNKRTGTSSSDVKIGGSASGGSGGGGDSSSSDSSTTITTDEEFDFWGTLDKEIGSILARPEDGESAAGETVVVNPRSGLVTVTGTRRQVDRISEYLDKTLKSLKKQVLIDVQILSVTMNDGIKTGIDWSRFEMRFGNLADFSYGKEKWNGRRTDSFLGAIERAETPAIALPGQTGKAFSFDSRTGFTADGVMGFLKEQGDMKALSNPKVLAMNNQPTLISVGSNINYLILSSTTLSGSSDSATQSTEQESIFVGVLLDITPQIDDDGYITLRINPSVSDFKYTDDDARPDPSNPRQIAPDTKSNRISSVVRVRDGDVVVLGGLISNNHTINEKKVPLLGDIPFLGKLFGSKQTIDSSSEVVFVLTPRLVSDDKPKPSLKDLGFRNETAELHRPLAPVAEPKLKDFNGNEQ
ncbi:pilus (MSHA type) biogenesis protein MshL [Campylobacterota bacterium]|nr:pilus (MSHA type) biogenesis protein MshL [Campylobacterota bacterium]